MRSTAASEISALDNTRAALASYGGLKRGLDIVGSLIGLVFFAALYPIIGLLIQLESRGPVLVSLDRVSLGKTIKLYKFRSMVHGAHAQKPLLMPFNERRDGPFFKMKHDPRLTRVGRFIRRFRLDEVPQFINVLRGELSLVGPRPHEPGEIAEYPAEYSFLAECKGGITGLSQVNGSSALPFLKELELDAYYARHVSLRTDLAIIGKTIAIFLFDHTAV